VQLATLKVKEERLMASVYVPTTPIGGGEKKQIRDFYRMKPGAMDVIVNVG